jgi:DNA-binding NtrC family response regulator
MPKKDYPLIYVVEDNMAFGQIVAHHLKINKYTNVTLFISGEECLKHLNAKPDIVIQDYKLQGISGLNVLEQAKKILPHTEFIFLSAQDNADIAVDTMKAGAFDYIVKNEVALHRILQNIGNIITLQKQKKHNRLQRLLIYLFTVFIILLVIALTMAYRTKTPL